MCADNATTAKIILPEGERPDSYFMFGPTPDDPVPHYYEFLFDGETGAVIEGNVITLHFVNGMRGDSDLDSTNGAISDPGGPVFNAPNSASGSGVAEAVVACVILVVSQHRRGLWWLLLAVLFLAGIWRGYGASR